MFLSFTVIERFCLPPVAKVMYNNATGTEVIAEIFMWYWLFSQTMVNFIEFERKQVLLPKYCTKIFVLFKYIVYFIRIFGLLLTQVYQATEALHMPQERKLLSYMAHMIDIHGYLCFWYLILFCYLILWDFGLNIKMN